MVFYAWLVEHDAFLALFLVLLCCRSNSRCCIADDYDIKRSWIIHTCRTHLLMQYRAIVRYTAGNHLMHQDRQSQTDGRRDPDSVQTNACSADRSPKLA
jgi:hypothetical protein